MSMDSPYRETKEDFNTLIETCQESKGSIESAFLEYQERVNFEWSMTVKERREFETKWERQEREEKLGLYSHKREEEFKIQSSFASSNSLFTELDGFTDIDAETLDDDSQETAMNHIANFQTRKTIQRKIRYERSHLHRVATMDQIGRLIQDLY